MFPRDYFKELLRERVIGHKDIRPSIAIKIVYRNSQCLSWRRCDTASLRDILESSVAVVVVNQARYGAKIDQGGSTNDTLDDAQPQ